MSDSKEELRVRWWDKAIGDPSGYVEIPLLTYEWDTHHKRWMELLDKVREGDYAVSPDGDVYKYYLELTPRLVAKAPIATKIKRRVHRYLKAIKQFIGG